MPTSDELTQRAIKLYTGKLGAQQPAADLSGPATAGGLDYIVLRNLGGVLAAYRVLPVSRALKRLKRWPATLDDQPNIQGTGAQA
ncbi:hypothetical protein AVHY2522_13670 [Acidovorax sp. SUPP2522]|uniref:hypothetical protein n=1 Tax=unclassified Acidovorax TaxID=2684926 RepID=UPI00234AF8B1|nr:MULTISPECIES: hypothetical protein [unclassified Acidovorax]WCM96262.1 hypothetical protein M5C96_17725 [Acidovorax sp. GBBC 1281]GKT16993.1 hypothetical protein AVHY2522_13670 [Acidovorax sp. SUPP2522]